MGLTIHYRGRLKDAAELQSMIAEVRNIAIDKKWEYHIFEEEFENNKFTSPPQIDELYGIMVVPEGCKPLCLSFLSDGRMCGLLNFTASKGGRILSEDLTFSHFTLTQYAGAAIHKELIVLLDLISKKYLADFECYGEGQYWETRDENLLNENFNRFGTAIECFASFLEMMPPNENENMEDYIIRPADATQHRMDDVEESLPELPIEDEIQFKRMKIELEHGGSMKMGDADIPPEIENQFLDYVLEFERQYKNARRLTIFEKIGQPVCRKSDDLSKKELKKELDNLFTLLEQHNIYLEEMYDYENENKLIYDFITQELFEEQVDDIAIPGMNSFFTYEEFYPNHEEDLRKDSVAFWQDYFENDSEHFNKFTLQRLQNFDEINAFRQAFEKFKYQCFKYKF